MRSSDAEGIARALGGHRAGHGWMARCPAHDDRTPSLAITGTTDGKVLVRCHAGCDQAAVISALRERGLWRVSGAASGGADEAQPQRGAGRMDERDKTRMAQALRVWCETIPAEGTLVDVYLKSRGIRIPVPRLLHFHPSLNHRSGASCRP